MHFSRYVLLLGAGVCILAQLADSAVDCCAGGPPSQPLSRCPVNEHFETDSNSCQITCENMEFENVMGACLPTSACYCNTGYVRGKNGTCIKRKDCRTRNISRTESVAKVATAVRYTPTVETGLKITVRDYAPKPPKCNKGEEWSDCGSSCPKSCDNRDNTCLMCTMNCVPGCYCTEKTIRGPNNTCVTPENCPPRKCSGPNEVLDLCPPTCPRTEKCENLWSKKPCTPIDCCEPMCRCKPGYFRNDKNVCVTAKQCTMPACGPNEVSTDCLNDCQKTCKNRFKNQVCTQICKGSGCICKPDYFRHDNGTCVQEYECSPADCKKGEAYNDCGSSCPSSCENKGNTCIVCTEQCVPGCYCAGKTIRAQDGTCVKPKNCPPRKCTGRNEIFDLCPPTCPRTEKCENLWSKIPCTPIDCCKPQCRCKPGYFRNDQNICVTAKQCSMPACGPNEVSTDCLNDCQKTCKNRFKNQVCTQICKGSGCICKPDYFRHDNGTCVQEYECSPAYCKKGEAYNDCGSSCPPSCENKGNTCIVCTEQCVPGCYCAGKTIRAQDGTCVKPENCPPRKCTGRNEIFDLCPPTCPRTEKCENLWSKIPCTPIDCCKPQCRCKPGYFRNDQNICVTAKQCSMPACGPNEVSTDCLNDCQKTCKNRFKNQVCTQICKGSGCICKPDYFRHDNGTCVQEHECSPADCNKGEVYSSCGSACPPSCENKGNTCIGCTAQCVPGCYCAGKTIRAQDGTCVKPENCPPRRCSGRNEIFDPCPPTCPRTDKCENLWSKKPCTPIDCCEPKCRCKPGYYRNDQNVCVTAKQCSNPVLCGREVSTD